MCYYRYDQQKYNGRGLLDIFAERKLQTTNMEYFYLAKILRDSLMWLYGLVVKNEFKKPLAIRVKSRTNAKMAEFY